MSERTYQSWLSSVLPEERKELEVISGKQKEINERFGMPLAFGTAGMRGEIGMGTFRMNTYTVRRATYGLALFIKAQGQQAKNRGVVISYDTRRFSYEFALAAAAVLSKAEIRVWLFEDVRPVPVCSYAVRKLNAAAGIMVTASHNPKEYNGYKVYGDDGAQMSPEDTAKVVEYIDTIADYFDIPTDEISAASIKKLDNHKLNEYVTVVGASVDDSYYEEILKLCLSPDAVQKYGKSIKLVYTPIHGAGYVPVTTTLNKMGINASLVEAQTYPDTEFSTVSVPNPENADTLKMAIELGDSIGADVVIGTDPDCDRMGLAVRNTETKKFMLLNGNQIGVLLLDYILTRLSEEGAVPRNGAVVKTIVTTSLADKVAESFGIKVYNVLTGFKFIGEKIKEWELSGEHTFIFGYEESYGYLRGTHARDKDAVVACMLTAEMACYYEGLGKGLYQRLTEIFEKYGYYCEENASIVYKGIEGMQIMSGVMSRLREKFISSVAGEKIVYNADYKTGEKLFADGRKEKILLPATDALYYALDEGFICIRPSGTEPKLKIYILCKSDARDEAKRKAQCLMEGIKREL
ncbi:MAG: phospho-sugar mutase [Clostridia bacterium]|nr:phospho-sugar mutase [Clostridia bacterium]